MSTFSEDSTAAENEDAALQGDYDLAATRHNAIVVLGLWPVLLR
jgi:hypothetical protein